MKHCKKIISSILTLTLFAGSVVSLSCSADPKVINCYGGTVNNFNSGSTDANLNLKKSEFNRCKEYSDKLKEIMNSVNGKSSLVAIDKAFKNFKDLKNQIGDDYKQIISDDINNTKSYLNETRKKACQYADKKSLIKNILLGTISVGLAVAVGYCFKFNNNYLKTKQDLNYYKNYCYY